MVYVDNPGHLPDDCIIYGELPEGAPKKAERPVLGYRKIHAILFCGIHTKIKSPDGWPAAGQHPKTDWSISAKPHPFQIQKYEVI